METQEVEVTEVMLKCAYLLMSADGVIDETEVGKFYEFGTQYSGFENRKDKIMEECKDILNKDGAKTAAENILRFSYLNDKQKRYLLWILVNIGYADGEYSSGEKELIDFIAQKLEVKESLVLEFEDSAETLLALEEKMNFSLASKNPYPAKKRFLFFKINYSHEGRRQEEIDSELKSIENDREEIINSIKDLVLIG